MGNPQLDGIAGLIVAQILEQRMVLTEVAEHLDELRDAKSRQIAKRVRNVLADHSELRDSVLALADV